MSGTNGRDIIERYFEAYRSKDRGILDAVLADDFTFTSPRDDAIDRATYFDWCWANSGHIVGHELERVAEIEPGVWLVVYLCTAKGGRQFRNAEIFTLSGAKVRAVEVYFGTTFRNGVFVAETA